MTTRAEIKAKMAELRRRPENRLAERPRLRERPRLPETKPNGAAQPDPVADAQAPPPPTADEIARLVPAKPTIAEQLIAIGQQCELFHDERNDAYAVATGDDEVRRVLRLRGREFRRFLCGSFFEITGKAANGEAIASALGVLEAQATFNAPQHTLANRFAELDGAIYIDLCDERWQAARVDAVGWETVARPPLLFRRYAHQQPLPIPKRGGTLADLANFMHLRGEDDRRLVEAFIVAAPFANDPRPALDLNGPQGSAKSTTARVLKALLDPSATDTVELGRDPAALAQVLDHNAVPIFDNLTHISAGWVSDLLCKAVTGGGFSKRELYTDAEDIILAFKRAIIFTGINVPSHAPDLLDRMLLVELDRIDPAKRRDEREFWAEFERVRPRLFGALLDAVSGVLRERERVRAKLTRLPRMADFALLACAHAESTGFGAEPMLRVIEDNTAQQTIEAVESDSLAVALREYVAAEGSWKGTPTDLLKLLNKPYVDGSGNVKPEDWPRSARAVGKRLRVLATTLAEVGIRVTFPKDKGKKRTRYVHIDDVAARSQTSDMSDVGSHASTSPPFDYRQYMRNREILAQKRRERWGKPRSTSTEGKES